MPYKKRKRINWSVIDACKTADEIVDLLRKHDIKGQKQYCDTCPLAIATGYTIRSFHAINASGDDCHLLTKPEIAFLRSFDDGQFPDLEEATNAI